MLIGDRDRLAIELHPLASGWERRYAPERTGWAELSIWINGRNLCRNVLDRSQSIRESVNVPLGPLADWLIRSWTFIRFEERPDLSPLSSGCPRRGVDDVRAAVGEKVLRCIRRRIPASERTSVRTVRGARFRRGSRRVSIVAERLRHRRAARGLSALESRAAFEPSGARRIDRRLLQYGKRVETMKIMGRVDRHGLPLAVNAHAANHREVKLVQPCFDSCMHELRQATAFLRLNPIPGRSLNESAFVMITDSRTRLPGGTETCLLIQ